MRPTRGGNLKKIPIIAVLLMLAASVMASLPVASEDEGSQFVPMLDIVDHRLINSTYTSRIPIIDGVVSANEWDGAQSSSALWSQQPPAWNETGAHITGPGIQSDTDGSHVFWTMYDTEFLYFLFNCTDDYIFVDSYPASFWRDDSIEICIDGAFDRDEDQRNDTGYIDGDTFNVPADGRNGIAYSAANGSPYTRIWGPNNDWFSAVSNMTTYYIVEVAIRLNTIDNPAPNDFIGLNTGQNDDDDGGLTKEGVIRWQGIDGYSVFKNETLWGNLYFVTRVRADAGNSQVINQTDTATFDGRASTGNHPDFGNVAAYNWTFMYDGSEVTLNGVRPTFKFDIPGDYTITLNVTDGTGSTDTDTVLIGVRDIEDPVANAGPDINVDQGVNLTLNASLSTDNHPELLSKGTFEWDFWDVKVVRLEGLTVNYVFNNPGEFVIKLKVTDPSGLNFATDSLLVTVKDIEPPVADAGPDLIVDDGQYVNFDGSASSDNFEIMTWVWEFTLGTNKVNITGQKVPYRFPAPGVYHVTMYVFDYDGQSASDDLNVTVEDVTPPVADAGEVREFNEDVEVTLNAELSFDDVGIITFEWTISLEGVDVELEGKKVKYNFTQPGVYDVTLRVTDGQGQSSEDTVSYRVLDVTKPHGDAGTDRTVDEDAEVTFSGNESVDNVAIADYSWSIESATPPRVSRTGETFNYVFATPGEYTVTLTVTDGEDNWDSDAISVTVLDVTPPIAEAPSGKNIKVGQTVDFDGRASSDNVGIVKYEWEYTIADVPFTHDGANVTQQFDSKGNYTITLTVWDEAGNSDSTSFWVDVTKPKEKDDEPGFGVVAMVAAVVAATLLATVRRRRD